MFSRCKNTVTHYCPSSYIMRHAKVILSVFVFAFLIIMTGIVMDAEGASKVESFAAHVPRASSSVRDREIE